MARVNVALTASYMSDLKLLKEKPTPIIDEASVGILLALIKERPTIWNSSAKLTKDDVLASFQQCSHFLTQMKSEYTLWVIIEKWCWMVESYMRCISTNCGWRFNNALDFLQPFNSPNYPYLGCLSRKRLGELTKLYNDPEITLVMEATDTVEFLPGIFREEMAFCANEEFTRVKAENDLLAKTVGQVVNAKRRGRPAKTQKSPNDQFTHLTPNSEQFQKLLESSHRSISASSSNSSEASDFADDMGFTPAMYAALIEIVKEKPELWQQSNSHKDNMTNHDQIFEDFGKELSLKFNGTVTEDKLNGPNVRKVWNKLRTTFLEEEKLETTSKWKYNQSLQFLSNRSMPAFFVEQAVIKSEEPSTSRVGPGTSPAGSSQSEDTRMAASSPAAVTASIPMLTGSTGKSIQSVLDQLVAKHLTQDQLNKQTPSSDYSELRQMLVQAKPKTENENGPPAKRIKQESPPPANSRMIVFNDGRKTTQAPISTWVPPREDLASKVKEEPMPTTPKKAQATAVIKASLPIEKQLKKMFQQSTASLGPSSTSSVQGRNGILNMTPLVIPQSAIQQALLKKTEHSVAPMTMSAISSIASQHSIQPQIMQVNGSGINGGSAETEDKWSLLGRMITILAREVESRDPVCACELFRDLHQVVYQYQIKALKKESQ